LKDLKDSSISEFYRFVSIYPDNLPVKNAPNNADREFNHYPLIVDSEAVTYREAIVVKLLQMPLSETKDVAYGPISAIYPFTVRMARDLINRLAATTNPAEKQEVMEKFRYESRFWRGMFQLNNWSLLFGKPLRGIFKRISEPDVDSKSLQAAIRLLEFFYDLDMYDFFEALQKHKRDNSNNSDYQIILQEVIHNKCFILKRMKKARDLLIRQNEGVRSIIDGEKGEKDPQRKSYYEDTINKRITEVNSILNILNKLNTNQQLSEREGLLTIALVVESLMWELHLEVKDRTLGNNKFVKFIMGAIEKSAFSNIWEILINEGYIDPNGIIQKKFRGLTGPSGMSLPGISLTNKKKKVIYDILQKARTDVKKGAFSNIYEAEAIRIWKALIKYDYIDSDGVIQLKFRELNGPSNMFLPGFSIPEKQIAYDKLYEALTTSARPLLDPIIKTNDRYLKERSPYVYWAKKLSSVWKGDFYLWWIRILAPPFFLRTICVIFNIVRLIHLPKWLQRLLPKWLQRLLPQWLPKNTWKDLEKASLNVSSLKNFFGIHNVVLRGLLTISRLTFIGAGIWLATTTYL
jgi:hypothetical protein